MCHKHFVPQVLEWSAKSKLILSVFWIKAIERNSALAVVSKRISYGLGTWYHGNLVIISKMLQLETPINFYTWADVPAQEGLHGKRTVRFLKGTNSKWNLLEMVATLTCVLQNFNLWMAVMMTESLPCWFGHTITLCIACLVLMSHNMSSLCFRWQRHKFNKDHEWWLRIDGFSILEQDRFTVIFQLRWLTVKYSSFSNQLAEIRKQLCLQKFEKKKVATQSFAQRAFWHSVWHTSAHLCFLVTRSFQTDPGFHLHIQLLQMTGGILAR